MKRRTDPPRTVNIPIESDADEPAAPGPDPAGAPGPGSDAEAMSDDLEVSTRDLEDALDHLRRLQAEFENYRRRTTRERAESGDAAQAALVERLLPVLDDLDRACEAVPAGEREASLFQGFALVRDKLRQTLVDAGLERVAAVGEDFDPQRHEALLTEPVEADRAGKVLDEFVTGYTFRGRMVRPARVKVGMEASGE